MSVEWWLFEVFIRDEFSLRTPVQAFLDSFEHVFPESIRLVWAPVSLVFLTFNSLRVITAKADVSDAIP